MGTRGLGHRTPGCPQENTGPHVDGAEQTGAMAQWELRLGAGQGVFQPTRQLQLVAPKDMGASLHRGAVTRSAWADLQPPRTTLVYGHTTLNTHLISSNKTSNPCAGPVHRGQGITEGPLHPCRGRRGRSKPGAEGVGTVSGRQNSRYLMMG